MDKVAKWLPFTAATLAQISVALTASVSNMFHFDGHGKQEVNWHCVEQLPLKDLALQETVNDKAKQGLASKPG